MKTVILTLLFATATSAFVIIAPNSNIKLNNNSIRFAAENPDKINIVPIQPDSPKVVDNLTLEAGKKGVFCRCWLSGTFPNCDGTHAKHNEETGDNVGPLIVAAAKSE
uniref:Iron-binding zinc finger CDGSH type domain-containing protein n=1 Tax=Thalassionema nitzschioides TaxID=33649 RepID=A0A6V0VVT1_9STRA|mmetsp:Transcript_22350/g.33020  ORF Transcript_22350/g.33020 Transcript_22350/m.33020 type:complete len:108 (-) Transcript_22350:244-567(-)|eukprot:CAMPEP_0194203716 /NCGR_PEP_ID=MMETSP0156-20130528/3414_1 /TAXON_ID=33649 /ORGANISM="Thalassionema nitzschioides, Strain L26-B" /LENGTH=107 /DNA_ID=CAMNT_0038929517 /DNA_START=80 /DNA_END=403 /DNA_ORIENTATION=-